MIASDIQEHDSDPRSCVGIALLTRSCRNLQCLLAASQVNNLIGLLHMLLTVSMVHDRYAIRA